MYKIILISVSILNSVVTDLSDSDAVLAEQIAEILELDKTVCLKLTTPSFQDGMTLLSELMNLHLLLTEVGYSFSKNQESAWKIMDILEDSGGLRVLNTGMNGTLIQRALRWPDDKVNEIKSSLTGINALWRDLRRSAKEPLSNANYPKDINFHFEPI